jgi:serine/threonine protein kinase/tetratricopeptide (TPR) repeat protein
VALDKQAITAKTVFDERYEILDVAGEGGMGTVYRARHTGLDRIVAIKVMRKEYCTDPDAIRRFQHEAQMAKALEHPHIAAVRNFGVFNEQPYIVFDFLEGEGFEKLLEREGKLPFARFVSIFQQVCDALGYAHTQGVIHRDIKPSNIFLQPGPGGSDDVQVLDFGIAKAVDPVKQTGQRLTVTGAVLGTPVYMSPEQGRGEKVSYTSDVYSLACLMYQACFGQPPFEGESAYQILFSHTYDEPALDMVPAGYPPGILDLIRTGLSKEPANRYPTAVEFGAALAALTKQKASSSAVKLSAKQTSKQTTKVAAKSKQPSSQSANTDRWKSLAIFTVISLALVAIVCTQVPKFENPFSSSLSRPQIESQWRESHNTAKLRADIKSMLDRDFAGTCAMVRDMSDDLFVHADLDVAGIFFDIAKHIGPGSVAAKPFIHDGVFVLRLCPEEVWTKQKPEATAFLREWAGYQSAHPSTDDLAKQLLWYSRMAKTDGNNSAAMCALNEAIATLEKLPHEVGGDTALVLRETATIFGERGEKALALKLLSLINLPDATARFPALTARADLFDKWSQPVEAVKSWRAAYSLAASATEINPVDVGKCLQSLADDELATGDEQSASNHFAQVREHINGLAAGELRWSSLLRLADAYSVMNKPEIARQLYQQGLDETKNNKNREKTNIARIYLAQFAWHLGDTKQAISILDQGINWTSETATPELVSITVQPARSLAREQEQSEYVVNALNGAKRAAAVKAEAGADNETIAAEWCVCRHDYKAAAEHRLKAAQLRSLILPVGAPAQTACAIRNLHDARAWADVVTVADRLNRSMVFVSPSTGTASNHGADVSSVVLWGDALFHLNREDEGSHILKQHAIQELADNGNVLCMRGWIDKASLQLMQGNSEGAYVNLKAAYEWAKEHRLTLHPQFREAGFLCLRAFNAAGKDLKAQEFVKAFYAQLKKDRKA